MAIVLDYNPLTRETVTFELVGRDNDIVIGHSQDTTHIIEANKRDVIELDAQGQMKRDWIKYARVPNIVIMEWRQKFGVNFFNRNHQRKVMELINSRDYKDCKTTSITHDR
jgi:uncharacterized lipoprotein